MEKDHISSYKYRLSCITKKILNNIFAFIWTKRLAGINYFPYNKDTPATVVRVKGWRTAIIDPPSSGRITATWMFKIFKWYF